jgi:hypothetical protein
VPGSLNKKGGRRFHLLLRKRLHLFPPFLSNEPGTGLITRNLMSCCFVYLLVSKQIVLPYGLPLDPKKRFDPLEPYASAPALYILFAIARDNFVMAPGL